MTRCLGLLCLAALLVVGTALAQSASGPNLGGPPVVLAPATPPPGVPGASWWQATLAAAVNTGGVLLLVQGIAWAVPYLRERIPWAVPILALVAGPAVAWVQSQVAAFTGLPIDLSQVQVAFQVALGAGAVAVSQIYSQQQRVAATGGGHDRRRLVASRKL